MEPSSSSTTANITPSPSTPLPSRHRYWTPSALRHSASTSLLSLANPSSQTVLDPPATTTPPLTYGKPARNRSDVVTPVLGTPDGKSLKSSVLSPVRDQDCAWERQGVWERHVKESSSSGSTWHWLKTSRVGCQPASASDDEIEINTTRHPSPQSPSSSPPRATTPAPATQPNLPRQSLPSAKVTFLSKSLFRSRFPSASFSLWSSSSSSPDAKTRSMMFNSKTIREHGRPLMQSQGHFRKAATETATPAVEQMRRVLGTLNGGRDSTRKAGRLEVGLRDDMPPEPRLGKTSERMRCHDLDNTQHVSLDSDLANHSEQERLVDSDSDVDVEQTVGPVECAIEASADHPTTVQPRVHQAHYQSLTPSSSAGNTSGTTDITTDLEVIIGQDVQSATIVVPTEGSEVVRNSAYDDAVDAVHEVSPTDSKDSGRALTLPVDDIAHKPAERQDLAGVPTKVVIPVVLVTDVSTPIKRGSAVFPNYMNSEYSDCASFSLRSVDNATPHVIPARGVGPPMTRTCSTSSTSSVESTTTSLLTPSWCSVGEGENVAESVSSDVDDAEGRQESVDVSKRLSESYPLMYGWTMSFANVARESITPQASESTPSGHFRTSLPCLQEYATPVIPMYTGPGYENGLFRMFDATTVEAFCGGWKAMRRGVDALAQSEARAGLGLSRLRSHQSIHFFRTGVLPLWEDKRCKQGGRLMIHTDKNRFDEIFEAIVMCLVGDMLPTIPGIRICGVTALRRDGRQPWSGDRIEVWLGDTRPVNLDGVNAIRQAIHRELGYEEIRSAQFKKFK